VRFAIIVLGAGCLVLIVALLPAILRRLGEPAPAIRTVFNATALRMFAEAPLTGLGPGMWPVERIAHTAAGEQDYYIPHAHNLYLQTLAELGFVGALIGLLVIGLVLWLIARGLWSPESLSRRLAWASLIGFVYLGTHQLFDFYANLPSVAFAFALSIGRLDALLPAEPVPMRARTTSAGPGSLVAVGVLATCIVLASIWLVRAEAAALDGQRATDSANRGDWAAALPAAEAAVAGASVMPPYEFTLGLALAHADRPGEALAAMRRAAEVDDYPLAWLNVAQLQAQLGNEAGARTALERALRVGYQNPQVELGAMPIYLGIGDYARAVDAAAAAIAQLPSLASDPAWASTPELERVFADALPLSMDWVEPGTAFWVAVEAERLEDAERQIQRMDPASQPQFRLILDAWRGSRAAFEKLNEDATASPLDMNFAAICHRVAAHGRMSGSPWECTATPVEHAPVVRMGLRPDGRQQLPGPNAPWHFQYVYRRLAPFDELVPGIPHLVWVDP
jgi:hypothetical protein